MGAPSEDFRETLYTVDRRGRRRWVYSSVVKGRYYRCRRAVVTVLMAIYLLAPWLELGGEQLVLIDIANRKFSFFGTTFWATDMRYLAFLLGLLGMALFFFTSVLGRVWCGWACPETVFLEFLFRPLETWIEGSPAQRRQLDEERFSPRKLGRKGLKYTCFILFSLTLSATALAYFLGREKTLEVLLGPVSAAPLYWAMLLTLTSLLLFQFGWFREQLCTAMCPYARFQSVLLDEHSLAVAYDSRRGEPRMALREARQSGGGGDCIDCGLCVRVCPTGIDIRNGLQLECIHCANCIDACNSVMKKIQRPLGLIRYDTEAGASGHVMRPRVLIYGALLLVFFLAFVHALSIRQLSEFKILRAPGMQPFERLADGAISNSLQLHIANKSEVIRRYDVSIEGAEGIRAIVPMAKYPINGGSLALLPLFVVFPRNVLAEGKVDVSVLVRDDAGFEAAQRVTLLGPE